MGEEIQATGRLDNPNRAVLPRRRFLQAAAGSALGLSAALGLPVAAAADCCGDCSEVSCVIFAEGCQASSCMPGWDTWHGFYNCYDYYCGNFCYEVVYDTCQKC
jgi:hypothetical protein